VNPEAGISFCANVWAIPAAWETSCECGWAYLVAKNPANETAIKNNFSEKHLSLSHFEDLRFNF